MGRLAIGVMLATFVMTLGGCPKPAPLPPPSPKEESMSPHDPASARPATRDDQAKPPPVIDP
jgi:hypothetical protein